MPSVPSMPIVTAEDLTTNQEVRWCPGCGDFSILAQLKQVLAGLGIPREDFVLVSGGGCAGRLPYYMNTYGFHGIQGRSPALATGIKVANPKLHIWVVTGDFDYATGTSVKAEHTLYLEHGRALVFGKDRNLGIRLKGLVPEVVTLGNETDSADLLIHDESAPDPTLAFLLSRLVFPEFPEC